MRPMKRIKDGDKILFDHGSIHAVVEDKNNRIVRFNKMNVNKILTAIGRIPLPPYIKGMIGTWTENIIKRFMRRKMVRSQPQRQDYILLVRYLIH